MSSEMFEELEKAINEGLEARNLDVRIKIKGFKNGGFLTDISRKRVTVEEFKEIHEVISVVWSELKKKWFKEF